jgi:transcriptional regulator with XRE-family HTH domain
MKGLAALMRRNNDTLAKLAEYLNTDLNTVWRWKAGRNTPIVEIQRQICERYKCTLDELLNGLAESGEVRFSFVMDIREVESMEVRMNEFKLGTGDNDIFGLFRVPKDTDVEEIGRQFMNYLRAELVGDKVKRDELKKLEG